VIERPTLMSMAPYICIHPMRTILKKRVPPTLKVPTDVRSVPVEETPDGQGKDKSVEKATAHGDTALQAELKALFGEVPYLPGQRDHIWTALPAASGLVSQKSRASRPERSSSS